jgi:3'-5' exoribonuclease 1
MPSWLQGDILDIRTAVLEWLLRTQNKTANQTRVSGQCKTSHEKVALSSQAWNGAIRRNLNIPAQLKVLGLPSFEGRQHSGIDVSEHFLRRDSN